MAAAQTPLQELERRRLRYLNRELSALGWAERVLALAADPETPLLERVRFLSIVASNLDEFFMVRVAGLVSQADAGGVRSADGRTPRETLAEIRPRVVELVHRQDRLWLDELRPALAGVGIAVGSLDELHKGERERLAETFRKEILPILTPLAVGPGQPFPYISGLSLSLGFVARHHRTGEERLARVKVPEGLPRFVTLEDRGLLVPLEQVIAHFLPMLYRNVDTEGP